MASHQMDSDDSSQISTEVHFRSFAVPSCMDSVPSGLDDSHPDMIDMMELNPFMMELQMNEKDPLLGSVKKHLTRSESSDMEIQMSKLRFRWMKIQKVPEVFRRNKSSAKHYTPMVVSIGPYHHGGRGLDGMEETKAKMAANFVKNSVRGAEGLNDALYNDAFNHEFKRLYDEVASLASLAMGAYDAHESRPKNFKPDRLMNIMFVDGCFILEFIRYVLVNPERLPMDSHMAALVQRDLFLLENQLPFGVLRSLMKSSKNYDEEKGMEFIDKFLTHVRAFPPHRRELCRDRVCKCPFSRRSTNPEKGNNAQVNPQDDTHLLGLFQKKFIKNDQEKNMELRASRDKETSADEQEKGWYRYRAAMELKRVGIECEPAGTKLFTDIQFTSKLLGGKLKIPRLTIHESTMPLILNLVAYEATLNASYEIGVTSYICFMNSLIDRGEDISELRSKDILFHTLGGDEQVAKLFSDIANSLVPYPNAYSEVKKQIESHYRSDFKMWYNHYNSKIYSAIWKIVGLGTAIFGALKAFTSLTISPMPGMQLPGFRKFQLSNATLYH